MNSKIHTLICDLDNTLYDWVAYFVPSFYAMVDRAVGILECDREELLDDLREVHRAHQNTEEPFALLQTNVVRRVLFGMSLKEQQTKLDPAFYAFNSMRKRTLTLYPDVLVAMDELRRHGIQILAYTDSRALAAIDRVSRLGLSERLTRVYCRSRSVQVFSDVIWSADWGEGITKEKIIEFDDDKRKPDPAALLQICATERVDVRRCAYMGDSLTRDIGMARRAGVFAIWAEYGSRPAPDLYKKLVRVSHWTEQDVELERRLSNSVGEYPPNFVAKRSFSEVVGVLDLAEGIRE